VQRYPAAVRSGFAVAGLAFACTQKAADEVLDATRNDAATAVDEIRTAGEAVGDATADATERTANEATEIAGDIAMNTDERASTTSEAIADAFAAHGGAKASTTGLGRPT
jgi:hypothetical protein